jgi:toxin-antitoxin system PIN domain toxin
MTTYLLDINVLLALSDPMHLHHEPAHTWFQEVGRLAWASCAITENGFVRIASHPKYPNRPGEAQVTLTFLRELCRHPGHTFWAESVSLRDMIQPGMLITHNQITDLYLLALAVHKQGKLATFDGHILATAVAHGEEALEIIRA